MSHWFETVKRIKFFFLIELCLKEISEINERKKRSERISNYCTTRRKISTSTECITRKSPNQLNYIECDIPIQQFEDLKYK